MYAEHFDTVEVNATFYRLARESTVQHWLEQVPSGFRFAVKASRYLTHVRRLGDLEMGMQRFFGPLEPLVKACALGPVLWQLPETFHRDDTVLERWLAALPAGRHTIEFRHPSWFVDPVMEQLHARGVALTLGDHPNRPFQSHDATAPWRFIRFHYGGEGGEGNYSAAELDRWADRIDGWLRDGEVWAYFNNDWQAFAPANAAGLIDRLSR